MNACFLLRLAMEKAINKPTNKKDTGMYRLFTLIIRGNYTLFTSFLSNIFVNNNHDI